MARLTIVDPAQATGETRAAVRGGEGEHGRDPQPDQGANSVPRLRSGLMAPSGQSLLNDGAARPGEALPPRRSAEERKGVGTRTLPH